MMNEPKHYELTFIISGNASEDQHPAILEKIKNTLKGYQAENIVTVSEIGRRKLAYPINKLRHGFYFTWELDLLPQNLIKAEKDLKLNKDILRYIIVSKKIKTAEEIAHEEKVKAGRVKEQLAKEIEAAKVDEQKEKPVKTKVSLDDLDKKLDELLNEEIK